MKSLHASFTCTVHILRRPHVVIATPGRLRDHLQGPAPPDLSKLRFLVLDEADRSVYLLYYTSIYYLHVHD
jgi:superfamily II DNA/RNA helicase